MLKELGLKKGKMPVSLEELLRQSRNLSIHDINDDFDYDDFGDDGFDDFDDEKMDHDHESEWEFVFMNSDDELKNDEVQDNLKRSTKKFSDHANRNQKKMNNWIQLIAIVTEDTAMQESSPFCAYNKSTRSISTIFLSAGVLSYIMSLMMKDMSTWIFKYARRVALFVMICSISSVKSIIPRLQSNLVLRFM